VNKTIKKKWIAALRSGKYLQGRTVLRRESLDGKDHFCCLGVLADVIGCDWKQYGFDPIHRMAIFSKTKEQDACAIPPKIAKQIGLSKKVQNTLVRYNDVDNKSFEEIAKYIERYL